MEITLLSLMAVGATSAMATLAAVLAAVAFGCQLVRVNRRMHNYSNKLDQATRLLSSRRFPDELIGEMARVANFDAYVVQNEMKEVMSKMSNIQQLDNQPSSSKKGTEPNYSTGFNNTAPFGDDRNVKPSNDPNYQTLFGLDNLQAFGPEKNVTHPHEPPMNYKTVNDPNYQTLAGLDNRAFGEDKNVNFKPSNDPNYQTLTGLNNDIFEKQ